MRKLTPREYGILQAFPMDDWKQVVSDSQAYKQFGNAVTTTVFTAIAEEIAKSIYEAEGSEEKGMEENKGFNGMNEPEAAEEAETAAVAAEGTAQDEAAAAAVEEKPGNVTAEKLAEKIISNLFEKTILPGIVFDMAVASTIEYIAENMDGLTIGEKPEALRNWEAAENAVSDMLSKYAPGGYMGKIIFPVLMPLKERLEAGERTADLYNAIVEATR